MSRRRFLQCLTVTVLTAAILGQPAVLTAQGPPQGVGGERVEVIVGFHQPPGLQHVEMIENLGGQVSRVFWIVPAMTITIPEASIPALWQRTGVRYVEPNGEVWAHAQTVPWGIDRVFDGSTNRDDTWEISRGSSVGVAVLDTGIANHEDLHIAGGYNAFSGTENNYSDDNGHGTHVAGTIAALDNTWGVVGVAPAADLYAVKVLDRHGGGTWDSVAAGIEWAVENNIPIVNMSLGGSQHSQTLQDACDAAYAAGLLLVASAGNSGEGPDTVGYPAKYVSVIAVAASDGGDNRASFSSTGPDVELIAPGVGVYSTWHRPPGRGYNTLSGTSMASPHVAGVAALVWAADLGLSNDGVRDILQDTAEDLGLAWNHQGDGLVRADLALGLEPGEPDVAVNVAVSTDKAEYIRGEDNDAIITVVVTDEYDEPIIGLASTAFVTTLVRTDDTDEVVGMVQDTFNETNGTYTWALDISKLTEGTYGIEVEVTDGNISGSGYTVFAIKAASQPGELSIDRFDVTDTSNPAWARATVSWAVSGTNLSSVNTEMILGGSVVDSATSSVSDSSASGTHELRHRRSAGVYEIRLTVTDGSGSIFQIKPL